MNTNLSSDRAFEAARAFADALRSISPTWVSKYRVTRRFLARDPLERLVPERLVLEGVERLLSERPGLNAPLVVFMNRGGHGDGARLATGLLPIIARHWREVSVVHVSFNTPDRGLGALVRGVLTKTGAEHGIRAHAVAYNRPAQGLKLSDNDVVRLVGEAALVVSFASDGEAGLVPVASLCNREPLLAVSHLCVLSYPDPEGLVAELTHFERVIVQEPNVDAIRFWVQVQESDGTFEDLETALLGRDGNAATRLWPLIENARRRPYRVLVEPIYNNLPVGAPLVCLGRGVIERSLGPSCQVQKIVPAGSRLVAEATGRGARF